MTISRRRFLQQSAAAGLLGAAPMSLTAGTPWVRRSAIEPVVIASMNGNWYRNGGKETCVQRAWQLMTTGGSDVLDGLGISIISTSRGVMSDRQARKQRVGGEVLCNVW